MSISILNRGASGGLTPRIIVKGLSKNDTVKAVNMVRDPNYPLPEGYTQLEYIQSASTQYINTGLYVDFSKDLLITMPFSITKGSSRYSLFNSYADNTTSFGIEVTASNLMRIYFNNAAVDKTGGSVSVNTKHIAKFEWISSTKSYTLYLDGVSVISGTYSYSGKMPYASLLFRDHRSNSGGTFSAPLSIYDSKIKNGDVEFGFYPCYRNSDNIIGMYDVVNDVFYTNAGTGTFTIGEEIPEHIEGSTIINGTWTTGGYHQIDKIKGIGLWKVTATNGDNITTQQVKIDAIGLYEIEMYYLLYLYNSGDECEDITGGWNKLYSYGSGGLFEKNSNCIRFGDNSNSYSEIRVRTGQLIDTTKYSKLYIDFEVEYNYINGNNNSYGIQVLNSSATSLLEVAHSLGSQSSYSRTILSGDISNINEQCYFQLFNACANYNNEQIYGKVYAVWLEP